MSFSQEIYNRSLELQNAILEHPFITGIGDGSLDVEAFKHFIRQDYLYLIEYSRVFALAAARAPDLDTMGRFANLLGETLNTEMSLHRGYCARFGITEEELDATKPAPTTQAYTDFLVRTAYHSSFAELAAALLPCMWGYCEIGLSLLAKGKPEGHPLYGEWIDMYSSDEFKALSDWLRGLVDRLAEDASPGERRRMEEAYVTSSRYEHAFWSMGYTKEEWPA